MARIFAHAGFDGVGQRLFVLFKLNARDYPIVEERLQLAPSRRQLRQAVTRHRRGVDAFGLPAENAAIKQNINPRDWTMAKLWLLRELKKLQELEEQGKM